MVTTTAISQQEAKLAIEFCGNDEFEAAQRITMEPEFLSTIRDSIIENRNKAHIKEEKATTTELLSDEEDSKKKVEIKILAVKKDSKLKTTALSKGSNGTCRKGEAGFRLNGEKRVESLRLGDALKKLAKLRDKKLATDDKPSETFGMTLRNANIANNIKKIESRKQYSQTKIMNSIRDKTSGLSSNLTIKVEANGNISNEKENDTGNSALSAKDLSQTKFKGRESTADCDDIEYTAEDLNKLKWSDARIKAFLGRKGNPNAYYYRFNAVNEEQETGEWSEENRKLFLELIADGVDYRRTKASGPGLAYADA